MLRWGGDTSQRDEGGVFESSLCWPVSHVFKVRPSWQREGQQTLRTSGNLTLKRQIKAMNH